MIDVIPFCLQEVKLIGIDSLGFDLRLCAGAKIESLRFAFSTRVHPFFLSCFKILFLIYDILRNRADIIIDGINISCQSKLLQATSEENAEGQIRKLLFPKTNQSTQPKPKWTSQRECWRCSNLLWSCREQFHEPKSKQAMHMFLEQIWTSSWRSKQKSKISDFKQFFNWFLNAVISC